MALKFRVVLYLWIRYFFPGAFADSKIVSHDTDTCRISFKL